MGDAPEQELVTQAQAGDQLAIHRLLMHHHDEVLRLLTKKIPPDLSGILSAEDVCQEAYVVVVSELGSFQPRCENSFFNWLMSVAQHKLIDAIRAQRAAKRGGGKQTVNPTPRADAESVITWLGQVAVHEHTPSRSAADNELASAINSALSDLKEDYRTAIRSRYIEGLTAAETGKRMGRSEGAVLKLCERGLRQLADIIGDASRFSSRRA